jgi:hypothetical protein
LRNKKKDRKIEEKIKILKSQENDKVNREKKILKEINIY